MSFGLNSTISKPFSEPKRSSISSIHQPITRVTSPGLVSLAQFTCEMKDQSKSNSSSAATGANGSTKPKLGIGSPIIITEAPKMIKTAASVPCLRLNADLVKPGDVGRIVAWKPMDMWVIRLSIGTYLIDGKYFKPLELGE